MISLHCSGITPRVVTVPESDCLSAIVYNRRLFERYTAGAAGWRQCKLVIIPLRFLQVTDK